MCRPSREIQFALKKNNVALILWQKNNNSFNQDRNIISQRIDTSWENDTFMRLIRSLKHLLLPSGHQLQHENTDREVHTVERLGTEKSICFGFLLQLSISSPTSTRLIATTFLFLPCKQEGEQCWLLQFNPLLNMHQPLKCDFREGRQTYM